MLPAQERRLRGARAIAGVDAIVHATPGPSAIESR
jgi:hypothetical protein